MIFVLPCILLITGLWMKSCKHIKLGKGQHDPVFTSIVLFLMQQQKSQSAIKERKLGQILHCSAHCGRPNYYQNYTTVHTRTWFSKASRCTVFGSCKKPCILKIWKNKSLRCQKTKKMCKILVKLAKNLCISINPHKINKKIRVSWKIQVKWWTSTYFNQFKNIVTVRSALL